MRLEFELVQPVKEHAELIFNWRNDPVSRANSFHTELKEWDSFWVDFQTYFHFPDLPPLFALKENEKVAFMRFVPTIDLAFEEKGMKRTKRRCCSLSINVAPAFRERGIGTAFLEQIKPWIQRQGYEALFGEVKIENSFSRKMFLKAGYRELPESIKNVEGLEIPIVRFVAEFVSPEAFKGVLIIAEAGSNWRMGSVKKDMAMAKKLISLAAEAEADVVKFQVFRPETIYVENAGYLENSDIEEPMQTLFSDIMLPYEMIAKLQEECHKAKIGFMATPFSPEDFAAVDPFVERHKIASYELNYARLLTLAAKSKKPLFLSTGASTEEEIDWAVKTFFQQGGSELTLLQCTAAYPAPASSMNIGILPWLKQRFQVSVGLSDHSQDPINAAVMAVALGATVIEKHFTLDRRLPGPDHPFAIVPSELKQLVTAVRETEKMKGGYVKEIDPSEHQLRHFARRGIQAIQNISKGTILREGVNIGVLRPGQQILGLHSKFLPEIEGKQATRSIPLGQGIQPGDYA